MIRVALAVRSEILRLGLESLIQNEPTLELAGSLAAGTGVWARFADSRADVLVAADSELDLHELDEDDSIPPVVLIADEPEAGFVAEALVAGIKAVLPSGASPGELVAAIHAASAGLAAIRPADLPGVVAAAGRGEAAPGSAGRLSPRELEILQTLAEGLPNKQIAWKLGISEHTVKFHVAAILSKLGAGSRAQAVAIGIRRGLILI